MSNKLSVDIILNTRKAKKSLVDDLPRNAKQGGVEAGKKFWTNFNKEKPNVNGSSIGQNIGGELKLGLGSVVGGVAIGNIVANGIQASLSVIKNAVIAGVDSLRGLGRGIAEINTLLPENKQLTGLAADQINAFAAAFGTDNQIQAKAFYNIVSAGVKGTSKQLQTLNIANKAAVAGVTNINDAAKVLTGSINAYSKSGLTAQKASDILFAGVREGVLTFEELSQSLGDVTAISSTVGASFDEVVGTLAAITKNGIKTDKAVTGLRSVFAALVRVTPEAKKTAKDLGLEFSTSALRAKGLAGFLKDVADKTKGSEVALGKLFPNIRALAPILTVVNGNFKDFERILNATKKSSGSTELAFSKLKGTLDFSIKRLSKTFTAFLTNVVKKFGPQIKAVADSMTTIFEKLAPSIIPVDRRISDLSASIKTNEEELAKLSTTSEDTSSKYEKMGFFTKIYHEALDAVTLSEQGNILQKDILTKKIAEQKQKLAELNQEKVNSIGVDTSVSDNNKSNVEKSVSANEKLHQSLLKLSQGFKFIQLEGNKFSVSWSNVMKSVKSSAIKGLGQGVGAGFSAFGAALVNGKNALGAFGNAFLASIGQAAVALGTRFFLEGVSISFNPLLGGPAVGGALIGACAARATYGGVLSEIGGGGGAGVRRA